MIRPGLADEPRAGFDVVAHLAEAVKGSMAFDPNAVRDVTLGQVRELYGRRRQAAGAHVRGQVMPYDEVLRKTFRLRGATEEEAEAMVKQHLAAGGTRRAAPRK